MVTAAISLITCLSQKNPDEFKTCVSLAVSRLSRVSFTPSLALVCRTEPEKNLFFNRTVGRLESEDEAERIHCEEMMSKYL